MARKTKQIETKMIADYLLTNYAEFPYILNVPLGTLNQELEREVGYTKAQKMLRPYRPAVDGIVVLPRYILLVEAKVWNVINGLSKLPFYKSLVPITPELQQYMPRDVIMQLVVGWSNPNLERMAHDADIQLKIFCPDYVKQAVDDMHKYWTSEYRRVREERLKMREYFGIA